MSEQPDVVELLKQQHRQIRELFDEVGDSKDADRTDAFHRLVRLLAVHETAEEEVVHPYARRHLAGGDQVVDARIEEEERAKQVLSELSSLDTGAPEFHDRFTALRQDVLTHADAEERTEFDRLRDVTDQRGLETLARAVKAAEALAPTRPHPGTDSAAKNLAAGPVAAVIDRTRDAVRKAMGHS
ncbi:hemerythrin domain-containing protein [Streptomyces sp. NPDC052496]|uniref:hemerythrin domain-containing protein n=1 Tax=Streptomyces sp. NPDC052496 TaxID=3154951 RepID=UPI003422149C